MSALVVYESIYGNTKTVAEAIAEGLGGARVLSVQEASGPAGASDLLVVGGPTHVHGITTRSSRKAATGGDGRHGHAAAPHEPGLRDWLGALARIANAQAAAFDTRLQGAPLLTGSASHGIARRLRHHGYRVIGTESFIVDGAEGPLAKGELDRAREWGARLAGAFSGSGRERV